MDQSLTDQRLAVEEYYGKVLASTSDLQSNACCDPNDVPLWLRAAILNVDAEITDRFYGCGSPVPTSLLGQTVLDLGCGTGRDCYAMSQLVGPTGHVIGVDMTAEQIELAQRHVEGHMERFGFESANVDFRKGYIEDLAALDIADNSIDVVVSNCVINLSPDKESVFKEIFRVLKPGGELYFADVFADRRVPAHLMDNQLLAGECLAGALYIEDFRRMLRELGCNDFRITSKRPIDQLDEKIEAEVGMIKFHSLTIRTFKSNFEDICENYGHSARYLGTIKESPHAFDLDDHHRFEKGLPVAICGNTALMLSDSRYGPHFTVDGDFSTHYGAFDCAPDSSQSEDGDASCC